MQKTYMTPLDMALPFPEDQALTYMTMSEEVKIVRPPGVENLRQWGNMKLPEGKHKGKTFLETVENDYQYSTWMVNHKTLSSDWAKSFQEFVKAWTQMTANTVQGSPVPKAMSKGKNSTKSSNQNDWSETEEELILVSQDPRTEGSVPLSSKRSLPAEMGNEMMTEFEQDRVSQLQGQIAVLQRELAKMTNARVMQLALQ